MQINQAIELSNCIENRIHLGYTEYFNICTGHWIYTLK
jgi:hypothetical protein